MFPAGIPGIALVALRLLTAALLVVDEIAHRNEPSATIVILSSVVVFCLAVGALTPYAAVAAALCKVCQLHTSPPCGMFYSMVAIVISFSVAALGPGAYSLDCKLFGRHVVSLPSDKGDP